MLYQENADIEIFLNGFTPLHYALIRSQESVGISLINKGAFFNARDKNIHGNTPLTLALHPSYKSAAKLLIMKGANPNVEEKNENASLMWVAKEGREFIANLLITRGANFNVQDNKGATALIRAGKSWE